MEKLYFNQIYLFQKRTFLCLRLHFDVPSGGDDWGMADASIELPFHTIQGNCPDAWDDNVDYKTCYF